MERSDSGLSCYCFFLCGINVNCLIIGNVIVLQPQGIPVIVSVFSGGNINSVAYGGIANCLTRNKL